MGRVGEVLVKINDTVFAGEAMIRLEDDEVRTAHAKAELQYNLRKRARACRDRARTPSGASTRTPSATPRRAVVDSPRRRRSRRGGETRRQRLRRRPRGRAQEPRRTRSEQLPAAAAPSSSNSRPTRRTTAPTELEGQFAMARLELRGAEAALDNLIVRAPIAGDRVAGQYPGRRARVAVRAAAADRARRSSRNCACAPRSTSATTATSKSGNASWCARRRFAAATSPARCPRSRRSSSPAASARAASATSPTSMSRRSSSISPNPARSRSG